MEFFLLCVYETDFMLVEGPFVVVEPLSWRWVCFIVVESEVPNALMRVDKIYWWDNACVYGMEYDL